MHTTPKTPAQEVLTHSRLDYAPRQPLAWVSRHRRILILSALCIGLAAPIYSYWRPLTQRAMWLYWFHQAAAHRMPASVEMYVNDPQRAAKILAENGDYVAQTSWPSTTQPAVTTAFYLPRSYRQLSALDSRLNLVTEGTGPVSITLPLLFMGTLLRPDGTPRLVILHTDFGFEGNDLNHRTSALVLPLPGLFDRIPQPNYPGRVMAERGGGTGGYVKLSFLSANADPSDPTHLVVPYRVRVGNRYADPAERIAGNGVFDVHLQNDDSLLFKPRAGSWSGESMVMTTGWLPEISQQTRVDADPDVLAARASTIYPSAAPSTPGAPRPANR